MGYLKNNVNEIMGHMKVSSIWMDEKAQKIYTILPLSHSLTK
jgi:hypothetical protein